jgi:hypothetical protein
MVAMWSVGVTDLDLLPVAPVHLGARGSLLDGQGRSEAQSTCIGGNATAELRRGDGHTDDTISSGIQLRANHD